MPARKPRKAADNPGHEAKADEKVRNFRHQVTKDRTQMVLAKLTGNFKRGNERR